MDKHILSGADVIMSDDLQARLDETSLYDDHTVVNTIDLRQQRLLPRLEVSFEDESVMHSFECVDLAAERQPGLNFFSQWTITFCVNDPAILAKALLCKFQGPGNLVVGDEIVHEFNDLNERVVAISVGQAIEGVTVTYVTSV